MAQHSDLQIWLAFSPQHALLGGTLIGLAAVCNKLLGKSTSSEVAENLRCIVRGDGSPSLLAFLSGVVFGAKRMAVYLPFDELPAHFSLDRAVAAGALTGLGAALCSHSINVSCDGDATAISGLSNDSTHTSATTSVTRHVTACTNVGLCRRGSRTLWMRPCASKVLMRLLPMCVTITTAAAVAHVTRTPKQLGVMSEPLSFVSLDAALVTAVRRMAAQAMCALSILAVVRKQLRPCEHPSTAGITAAAGAAISGSLLGAGLVVSGLAQGSKVAACLAGQDISVLYTIVAAGAIQAFAQQVTGRSKRIPSPPAQQALLQHATSGHTPAGAAAILNAPAHTSSANCSTHAASASQQQDSILPPLPGSSSLTPDSVIVHADARGAVDNPSINNDNCQTCLSGSSSPVAGSICSSPRGSIVHLASALGGSGEDGMDNHNCATGGGAEETGRGKGSKSVQTVASKKQQLVQSMAAALLSGVGLGLMGWTPATALVNLLQYSQQGFAFASSMVAAMAAEEALHGGDRVLMQRQQRLQAALRTARHQSLAAVG